ncbi:uncharacterized protein FTOL_03849 [Fusarium torulosum]|uniref:Uncharacterized protein n=1 Tax=Fusarium torulosum TaxID=33205 RepID=A0AAE8M4T8_9HYPO|nr:uncharacterized protein FTOL_03849 [Fusarium torulosum]
MSVDTITAERDDLKGKLSAAEQKAAKLKEKVANVNALTKERDELNKKLESAEREAVILNQLRKENNKLMKQLEEAKKAQKAANAEVISLQTQVAALVAQINGGSMTRTKSGGGGRKPIKDPKRREELVIVRDPRNGSGLSHIVRRRNLNSSATRSSSQSDGSADS